MHLRSRPWDPDHSPPIMTFADVKQITAIEAEIALLRPIRDRLSDLYGDMVDEAVVALTDDVIGSLQAAISDIEERAQDAYGEPEDGEECE